MFFRTPRVEDNVKYLQRLGLLPNDSDKFIFSVREEEKLVLLGLETSEPYKPLWIAGFTVQKMVKGPLTRLREIENLKVKQVFYLSPRGKGKLEEQVEDIRTQLKQFLEVDTITNNHLRRFSLMLKELQIDADNYAWNVDVYGFLNAQSRLLVPAKRHLLNSVLFSDIEHVSRLTKLVKAGVPQIFIEQMWDLPEAWIIKASNSDELAITGESEELFSRFMSDYKAKRAEAEKSLKERQMNKPDSEESNA